MRSIIEVLGESGMTVVFPVHPWTEKFLQEYGLLERMPGNVRLIKPLGYLENFRKVLSKQGVCAIPLYVIKGLNPFWICLC
jgi:UDP-N-acetylglucosamine 2-epimerase